MENKNKLVIHTKNLPMRTPTGVTLYALLASDFYNWSDLTNGVIGTLLAIAWIIAFYAIFTQKKVDIFSYFNKK